MNACADTRLWKETKAKFSGGDEPEDGASLIRYLLVTDGVATFNKGKLAKLDWLAPQQQGSRFAYLTTKKLTLCAQY